jgi:hypothetical protein
MKFKPVIAKKIAPPQNRAQRGVRSIPKNDQEAFLEECHVQPKKVYSTLHPET